jgi:hypothetical protein
MCDGKRKPFGVFDRKQSNDAESDQQAQSTHGYEKRLILRLLSLGVLVSVTDVAPSHSSAIVAAASLFAAGPSPQFKVFSVAPGKLAKLAAIRRASSLLTAWPPSASAGYKHRGFCNAASVSPAVLASSLLIFENAASVFVDDFFVDDSTGTMQTFGFNVVGKKPKVTYRFNGPLLTIKLVKMN